jgi:NADP-dependent 3-hydroxy acid dehydrogenase YdfG
LRVYQFRHSRVTGGGFYCAPQDLLTADEVADVVLFTVTRPRRMRILTTSFRPMTEASWG